MFKFNEFLEESLVGELTTEDDPRSPTAKEARKMGLSYAGFGRYADNTGAITYVVNNNKLIPFRGAEDVTKLRSKGSEVALKGKKENTGKEYTQAAEQGVQAQKEINRRSQKYSGTKTKELLSYDRQLKRLYNPNLFTPEELNALQAYSNEEYQPINSYLYKGFTPETPPDVANQIMANIDAIDSAFDETGAPFEYTVYTGLSDRYDYNKLQPGKDYVFRGYVSTSLAYSTATDLFTSDAQNLRPVLEIDIKKGQKSIYMEGFAENPGEFETLLPRGTKIKIESGPHILDNAQLGGAITRTPVALFKCSIVEE